MTPALVAPALLLALTPLRAPLRTATNRAGRPTAQNVFGDKPAVQTWPSDPSITYTDYGLVSREQQRRAYASLDGFLRIANSSRVDAADLRPPLPRPGDEDWLSFERRGAVVLGASLAYPLLLEVLSKLIAADGSLLELTSAFLPAVSIIVGSLLSITLSIEYNRLQKIQDLAASESADLALLTRLIRGVFAGERLAPQRQAALEQVGEQISTLVKRSRREELELMLDRDPIGAIVDVLDAAAGDRAAGADPRLARAAGLTTTLFQGRRASRPRRSRCRRCTSRSSRSRRPADRGVRADGRRALRRRRRRRAAGELPPLWLADGDVHAHVQLRARPEPAL